MANNLKVYKNRENPIKVETEKKPIESSDEKVFAPKESNVPKPVFQIVNPQPNVVFNFDFYLVVKNAFNGYSRGDMILKDEDIQKVIDSQGLPNCLKVKRK